MHGRADQVESLVHVEKNASIISRRSSTWPTPSHGERSHKKKLPQSSPEVHHFLISFNPFSSFVSRVYLVLPIRSLSLVMISS